MLYRILPALTCCPLFEAPYVYKPETPTKKESLLHPRFPQITDANNMTPEGCPNVAMLQVLWPPSRLECWDFYVYLKKIEVFETIDT